jgi:hypothetical protein
MGYSRICLVAFLFPFPVCCIEEQALDHTAAL